MVNFFKNSIRARYVFALSLIAFFSAMAFLNLYSIIETQANDGEIINISGKQRMLSQKIALIALQQNFDYLQKLVNEMDSSHHKLVNIPMSKKIKELYFNEPQKVDFYVNEYIKNARLYIKTKEKQYLDYLLNNSSLLLKKLDLAVNIYQKEAEKKIETLKTNEVYIFALTIITLIFEAMFIFYPIEKDIKTKTKALVDEKNYANLITQANTNAIIVVDQNFDILTFNKSAEKIFGYSKEEMLYTKLLDDRIIPKQYLKKHIEGLKRFMNSGVLKNKDITFELEGKNKNGNIFPIRVSFGIDISEHQKIVVANIQDISDEKEKDSLIIQQSRLAAMGEMIGNIAHQWRQPLSAISTLASGAKLRHKNSMLSDEELYETLDKIKEHTKYLSNTIDDFRNFFSRNKEESIFDLNTTVDKSYSLVEASYNSNKIKVYKDICKNPINIKGRDSELSQVILNILNNAKDILIEKTPENKIVYIKSYMNDKYGYIEIYDNGGGIPEDIKLKIFDPYFTTKHQSKGTGIGLFMSNKIISQHFEGELIGENEEFTVGDETYFGAKFSIKIKLAS